MFGKIAGFEYRYQLRSPVFWVVAVLFFLLAFGATTISQISIGLGPSDHRNGPFALSMSALIFSLFYMFVTTAFVANVIVRDDETGYGPILRATRIGKFDYLYGRFAGAFLAAATSFLAVPLAVFLGSLMPWVDKEMLGPFLPQAYLFSYFALAIPNILLTSAMFFALATVTRSMMWTYVGVIGFMVLWVIGNIALDKPEFEHIVAMWDPLGTSAFGILTRYWTASERNTQIPALAGALLFNRAFVVVLSAGLLGLAYGLFRFQSAELSGRKKQSRKEAKADAEQPPAPRPLPAPRHDRAAAWVQFSARTRLDMGQVFKSPAYFVLLALGLFNAAGSLWFATDATGYGGVIYPVTRALLAPLMGSFGLIPMIIAIYYAGELVWRERERRTHEIVDSTPVGDWSFTAPKIAAIALVLLSTLLVSVLAAVVSQVAHGYFRLELDKYLLWYVLPQAVDLILLAVLAVFLQVLSPHKFIGWGLMVVYIVTDLTFVNLGLQHNLYRYGGAPGTPFSDMNRLGDFWVGAWWFRAYWIAFAALMTIVSYALWRRGTEGRLLPRLRRLPYRLRGANGVVFGVFLTAFVGLGGFIFVNTNVWNEYRTNLDDERWTADFEKALLRYENTPQPKIIGMKLDVDLWPHEPKAVTRGAYVFQNKTGQPIKEIHVRFDRDLVVRGLSIEGARPKQTFDRFNYRIFAFDTPMAPGETRRMSFITERSQKGFKNNGNETRVVDNGTFLNNFEIAPILGMSREGLLQDRAKRRKYGLPPELRMAKLGDAASRQFNYLRHDADFVASDITVTTDAGQTPIAPGTLVSERTWTSGSDNRRTARFVADAPILPFLSIQSARYAVSREAYKGVDLAVYYDPQHAWNIERMRTAMKASLDYYQPAFGPYQFKQLRFLEFPAYQSFAQAYAGTIPWSEAMFFIADYRNPEKIDMVTYVGAHEIGHQWWAHQVLGADQQGSTMLSETFAQYSALMVMKRMYGEAQIRKFLKFELNGYLRARGGDVLEEQPLARVENQQYVHYRKGSLVMYRLQHEVGEETVNRALRRLIAEYGFKGAPYPTTLDFLRILRAEVPADKQALVTDLFEKITLYDLKTKSASVKKRADGRYDVKLVVEARKMYADGRGKETNAPLNEVLDVGLFTAEPGKKDFAQKNVVAFERRPIRTGTQTLTFVTKVAPRFAGVDPYNLVIDRNGDDNVIKTAN
ncbi:aminopeptidase [Caulobacter sp. D4A]|uniref:ABC transporter permease/M1 family aminopeptidase n=1 Tax=unclassified Caulobacter TaxID=2648921 RepID=UPI000D739599|nr:MULTISPECIES: M1 family aminopeptidase [unclassified Caulobacter]PXA86397.1 aminopeptidase [Caulobacter sp. D4A]PXA92362.1 aminopeptidase [Caulobacter sp. D5]